ncbi:MAG TPA: amidohydrolase family protein, partial [Longimicrobiales bacterium]
TCATTSNALAQATAPSYVIRNVSVIATSSAPATRIRDVVISGRKISQLTDGGSARVPGATVIDGRGKFLIPGLIDSHVHIKQEDPLFLFVVNGVTTVQNMSGRPFHLQMREATNKGTLLGPRIVTTGPTTAEVGVRTPEEVEKLVLQQKALGYNAIKMYGSTGGAMTTETYHRLNVVGRAQGLRVVGHAPRNLPFQTVLDERQHSIDHMEEIIYTHEPFGRLLKPYVDVQFGRATSSTRDSLARLTVPNFAQQLSAEVNDLARAVKLSGLAVTPNLVFFRNIYLMTTDSIQALLRAPELAYAAPGQRLNWSPMLNNYHNAWRDRLGIMVPYFAAVVQLQNAITAAFQRAGVPIMTGTDSEGLGTQPGFAVHSELELFVRAGLKPVEALRAATSTPARVMQIADSVGSVEPGKIADLVLLDANPLDDIRNTRRIAGVFRAGKWVSRANANAMLDSLARSYAPVQTALASFTAKLDAGDAAGAIAVYRASPQRAVIAKPVERAINAYGYRVMGQNRIQDAIEIFRLNTEAFPNEYNTWDSLAEAYMNNNQNDLAIRYYKKVLELRPGDENATRMLKRLGVNP